MYKRKPVGPSIVGSICCDVCVKATVLSLVLYLLWRNFLTTRQKIDQNQFFEAVIEENEQLKLGELIEQCKDQNCLENFAQSALSARICGSPAVDGYAHVNATCLEYSPSNLWWQKYIQLGGDQLDLKPVIEEAADFDGLAVAWGIGNKVQSAEECAQQCMNHKIFPIAQGPFSKLPCNAFVWCPDEVCFEPDAHKHSQGDCWLKFTEGPANPEINMRGDLPQIYRERHPSAPQRVQWVGGVLLPTNVIMQNGTWGPRWYW